MGEVREQRARDVLDTLLRDRLLRLAFGKDMFALSSSGTFERIVDRVEGEPRPETGTVELVVGDDLGVRVGIEGTPDTTLPALPRRGDPTLTRLGEHVRDSYYDDSAGGIALDRLAGCRIEYSSTARWDHLLIHDDAAVAVPHVRSPD